MTSRSSQPSFPELPTDERLRSLEAWRDEMQAWMLESANEKKREAETKTREWNSMVNSAASQILLRTTGKLSSLIEEKLATINEIAELAKELKKDSEEAKEYRLERRIREEERAKNLALRKSLAEIEAIEQEPHLKKRTSIYVFVSAVIAAISAVLGHYIGH